MCLADAWASHVLTWCVFQGDFIYLVSDANGFNAQNAKFATYFVAEESG